MYVCIPLMFGSASKNRNACLRNACLRQMKISHSIKTSKVFGVECRRTNFLGRDPVPYFNGGESLVDSRPTLCYKAATYQVSNMGGVENYIISLRRAHLYKRKSDSGV
jgi:hypothetical protein